MPAIRKLPEFLINKIAAGEVIERPASVVKELMENALDAGAENISLIIEDGGRKLIRLSDDGCGIPADQLGLAVMPHATSKIASEEDLFSIHTMGFRGEALASIGSVSHLRVTSRPHDAVAGAEIQVAGDRLGKQSVAGCAPGTIVEVRDLFFNVPARRKFLRGANTELGHIQEQLARIALCNPEVEFELVSSRRTIKQVRRSNAVLQRIRDFYGEEVSAQLLPIRRDERGLLINGYAARPAVNRASGKWQYVFLNGRYIRDRLIQHAVKEAYRGLMEHSRYPVVFLFLTLDPARVDINVHPTKIEVRWQDSNVIYSQVLSALRDTLLQHDLTPALDTRRARPESTPDERHAERQRIAEFFKQVTPSQTSFSGAPPSSRAAIDHESLRAPERAILFQTQSEPQADAPVVSQAAGCAAALQVHRTYLVTETQDGLVVIDQHALHERIIYEQLKSRIADGALESQRMLIPETIPMTPEQISLLQAHEELLARLGIEITPFGEDALAIQSFPSLLGSSAVCSFVNDLVDLLGEHGNQPNTEVLIHALLDMMACKAAVKAGDSLTPAEIRALLEQRHLVHKSSNCPHGRPTALHFSLSDLERQFKRT